MILLRLLAPPLAPPLVSSLYSLVLKHNCNTYSLFFENCAVVPILVIGADLVLSPFHNFHSRIQVSLLFKMVWSHYTMILLHISFHFSHFSHNCRIISRKTKSSSLMSIRFSVELVTLVTLLKYAFVLHFDV